MDKSLKAKIRAVLAGADVVKPKVESEEDETYEDSEYEIDEQEDETPDDGPGKVSEEADYAVMKMMINSKLKQKIQELKGKKSGS